MNFKQKIFILFVVFVGLFSVFVAQAQKEKISFWKSLPSFSGIALAEDDDEDGERENEDEDEDEDEGSSDQKTSVKTEPQTYKQVIKLPDQIITKTIIEDVVLLDTDKDGIADASDPHPAIPEHLIVGDANGNGIDDSYEIPLEDINGDGIADNYEKIN